MISTIVVLFILIFLACGTAYLIMFKGYGLRDLLLLALFAYPTVLLRRFDFSIRTNILGSWYAGFELVLAGILVLCLLVKLLSPDSEKMHMFWPFVLLASLVFIGLVSGLFNAGSRHSFGAVLQACFRWFIPFLVICVAVNLLPKTREANARLIDSYILIYGVITPILLVISALFTAQMTRLMEWDPIGQATGAGFARGWTSVGSTITAGMLMVFAYGMALARVIRKDRAKFHAFVAAMCVTAILLTLSRSVLISLLLFHVLVFKRVLQGRFGRVFVSLILIMILLAPPVIFLVHYYSFERFFKGRDESMRLRWYSARAGLNEGLKNPLIGQGPGLLYWDVRQPTGAFGVAKKVMTVGRYASAKEPHNLYILVFAENGFIGLAFLIGALLCWRHRLNLARKYAVHLDDYGVDCEVHWSMLIVFLLFSFTSAAILIYPRVSLTLWSALLIGLHSAATVENMAWTSAECDGLLEEERFESDETSTYRELSKENYDQTDIEYVGSSDS